jgi:putative intracellular protease/amidase
MRWLFHVRPVAGEAPRSRTRAYEPESLAREGFIHASYRDDVTASARLYFAPDAELEVLQVDPLRLDARVEVAATPRGPMPHIHGSIPFDAVRAVHALAAFDDAAALPDRVTGIRFAFVAFEGMTLLDLVGVYDPLSRIRSVQIDPTSTCEIIGTHRSQVWSADGAALSARRVRPSLEDVDVLVIPGGPGVRPLLHDPEVLGWLATFPTNRLIASVCTGALLLGASGRLQGRPATTHATALGELAAFGATARQDRVVDTGQVVTAGGVTSGLDLGLHLIGRLMGDDAAASVARQIEWSVSRDAKGALGAR